MFKFSIIMDIDNCEEFIRKTTESIINQSLDFIKNTEIIFIYHESIDDSYEIISDYCKRFPENVKISADGNFKNLIQGQFVCFLNIKNDLPHNLLEKVSSQIKNHDLIYVDDEIDGICDFRRNMYCPDFNLSRFFINSDLVENVKFNNYFDEKLFIYKLLIENPEISMLKMSLDWVYNFDYDSDLFYKFSDELTDFVLLNQDFLPKSAQCFILFEFQKYILNEGSKRDSGLLGYLSEDVIVAHKSLKKAVKSFIIYLKNDDFHIDGSCLKTDDYVISDLSQETIKIDCVEITSDELNFTASLTSSSYPEDIKVMAVQSFENGDEKTYFGKYEYYPTTPRKNKKYLGVDWEFTYQFSLSIPLNPSDFRINFKLLFNDLEISNHIVFREFAGLSRLSNYMVKNSKILIFKGRTFYLTDYSYSQMIVNEFRCLARIFKNNENFMFQAFFYRLIYVILYPFMRKKRIWILSDRDTVSGDNAEYLFDYCLHQKDDISKYFVINRSSPDFNRLNKKYSNIVPHGSLKHKFLYLFSEKIITSQVTRAILNPFTFRNSRLYEGISHYDWCFIQHGVILHDLSSWIHKYNKNFRLFVTSSDLERNSIVNGDYNYHPDRVQVLGLSRYDHLRDNSQKTIVFAPTWRRNLNTKRDIAGSDYLKSINSLLNNQRLIDYAKDNGYKLLFKPHPDLWKFIDLIDSKFTISKDSYTDIFNKSSVFITDYSSVAFDFAYLKKPLIYYHTESFTKFHYDKGYFDYDTMGFGQIIKSEGDLVEKIISYIDNGCVMEDKYQKRVDEFFKFRDANNSKRIYDWLIYK